MPPPSDSRSLDIILFDRPVFLLRLQVTDEIPAGIRDLIASPLKEEHFLSVTRTREEISIASDSPLLLEYETHSKWTCFKVAGPMEHNLTGIMNALTTPLKVAGIPIFAISTWDTDYLLVPLASGTQAKVALKEDGWVFRKD